MKRIKCIARIYKVETGVIAYEVVAKKEIHDEDLIGKLLHEDMELSTFLENYEIVNFVRNVKDFDEFESEKQPKETKTEKVEYEIQSDESQSDGYPKQQQFGNRKGPRTIIKEERRKKILGISGKFTTKDLVDSLNITYNVATSDIEDLEKLGLVQKNGKEDRRHGRTFYEVIKQEKIGEKEVIHET